MPVYRKKPINVEARQWTGDNAAWITELTGTANFNPLPGHPDDPDATAQVLDRLHSTWVLLHTGDFIIRGMDGEFYPCNEDVFRRTYDRVEDV